MNQNGMIPKGIEELLLDTAEQVFKKDNLISFLRVAAANYLQDYRNQLLIWRQKRTASVVAGKRAFEEAGLQMREDAKPVVVLYPVISCKYAGRLKTDAGGRPVYRDNWFAYESPPVFELKYPMVSAFDLQDTLSVDGSYRDRIEDIDIFSAVRGNAAFTVEGVSKDVISEKGVTDYVNERFLIRDGCSEKERDEVLLQLFSEYFVETGLKKDPFLRMYLKEEYFQDLKMLLSGAALARFGLLSENCPSLRKAGLEQAERGDKLKLLMCLNLALQGLVETIAGGYLTYDETALCNSLLKQDKEGKVRIELMDQAFAFREQEVYLDHTLQCLYAKLKKADKKAVTVLCEKIRRQKLTTFPPCAFPGN